MSSSALSDLFISCDSVQPGGFYPPEDKVLIGLIAVLLKNQLKIVPFSYIFLAGLGSALCDMLI